MICYNCAAELKSEVCGVCGCVNVSASTAPPHGSDAQLSERTQRLLLDCCEICSIDPTGIKLTAAVLSGPYITLTGEQCEKLNQWADGMESV
jgi:hypothetical protein